MRVRAIAATGACALLLLSGCASAVALDVDHAVAPAAVPAGPPLWVGDLETGDLSQFQDGPWNDVGGTPPKVVTSPVRSGRYAVRLQLTGATDASDGICCGSRNELLPKFRDLKEGDDLYFGFSTYLQKGFALHPEWQLITQFKQNFDGSPPLALYVEDAQYKVEGGYGYPFGPHPFAVPIGPVTTDVWVDWVWHVKFSTDPRIGFVEVWQDGQLVVPRYAPETGTLYPGTGDRAGSYVKTGPYRDPTVTTPATMYLDNWRISTTLAAAVG
ncbi:polysaccharide lyase [Pseudonocardia sp. CA-107938]|uniref:polysaccharide lyase n=1 Tax=Pseudonocardia sp. CA-107938 TaxID=3240021 RepID=UPI003D917801